MWFPQLVFVGVSKIKQNERNLGFYFNALQNKYIKFEILLHILQLFTLFFIITIYYISKSFFFLLRNLAVKIHYVIKCAFIPDPEPFTNSFQAKSKELNHV